jgi:hypothetical protein
MTLYSQEWISGLYRPCWAKNKFKTGRKRAEVGYIDLVYDPVCFQMLQHNYGYYSEFQIVKNEMVNEKNNCVNLMYNI